MSKVKREAKKHPLIVIMIVLALAVITAIGITAVAYADEGATPTDQGTTEQTTVDTESAPPAETPTTEVVVEDTVPNEQPTETTEGTENSGVGNTFSLASMSLAGQGNPPPQPKGTLNVTLTTFVNAPAGMDNPTSYTVSVKQNGSQSFDASGIAVFGNLDLGQSGSKQFQVTGVTPLNGATVSYSLSDKITLTSANPNGTIAVILTWPAPPPKGALTVTLTFVNAPAGMDNPTSYTVAVKDEGSKLFNASGQAVFGNLDLGQSGSKQFQVTGVTPLNGATVSYSLSDKITLTSANPNGTIAVTLTWPKGIIQFSKAFAVGYPLDMQHSELYSIRLVCAALGYNETKAFDAGSNEASFGDLVDGTYTATETGPSGIVFTYDFSVSGGIVIDGVNKFVAVTCTNTVQYGSAEFTKVMAGVWPAEYDAADFKIKLVCAALGYEQELPFDAVTGKVTFDGLLPGTYVATESGPSLNDVVYIVSGLSGDIVIDAQNLNRQICVTNTVQYGSAEFTKVMAGVWPAEYDAADFKIKLVCAALGYEQELPFDAVTGKVTFDGLLPGTYVATESGPSLNDVVYIVSGLSGDIVIDAQNLNRQICVTNTVQYGSAEFTKVMAGVWPAEYDAADFKIKLVCAALGYEQELPFDAVTGKVTFDGLLPGTYVATESGPSLNDVVYIVSGLSGDIVIDAQNLNRQICVTNTVQYGSAEFTKVMAGVWPAEYDAADFKIKLVCAALGYEQELPFDAVTGKVTFDGLLPGTYVATESGPSLNDVVYIVSGLSGDIVIDAQNLNRQICVTNTVQYGSIEFEKTFTNAPPAGVNYASFKIRLVGPNGYDKTLPFDINTGKVTFDGLLPGAYTATEVKPSGVTFNVVFVVVGPYAIDAEHLSVTVQVKNTYVPPSTTTTTIHKDDRDEYPLTGTQIGIIAGVAVAVLIGGGILLYLSRRKVGTQQ